MLGLRSLSEATAEPSSIVVAPDEPTTPVAAAIPGTATLDPTAAAAGVAGWARRRRMGWGRRDSRGGGMAEGGDGGLEGAVLRPHARPSKLSAKRPNKCEKREGGGGGGGGGGDGGGSEAVNEILI